MNINTKHSNSIFQWKSRWCVMRKLSPVAGKSKIVVNSDQLQVYILNLKYLFHKRPTASDSYRDHIS